MKNIFTKHPHSLDETYLQHFVNATCFSLTMFVGGIACLIHAIFPFWFQHTGSNILFKAVQKYINRMPHAEDRIVDLSYCIEKKLKLSEKRS